MRRLASVVALMTLAAACADATTSLEPVGTAPSSVAATEAATTTDRQLPEADPLVGWCASVDPDHCMFGLQVLAEDSVRRDCVFASSSERELLDCLFASRPRSTATTIPSGGQEGPSDEEIRAWRRAAQAEIERVLPLAHPGYLSPAALLLAEPMALAAALAVVESFGFPADGAWMAVPVCVDGYAAIGMGGRPDSVRFAYLDGRAEAARREAALTADGSVLTARFNFDAAMAALVQASDALHRPDVVVEAVSIRAPVDSADRATADPRVRGIRFHRGTPYSALAPGDITPQPPACQSP